MIVKSMTATMLLMALQTSSAYAREDPDRDSEQGSNRSISHVNGSIRVDDDEQARELESVNGSITIGDRARVGGAETVNGSIRVGDDSRAERLSTVNGRISIGARTTVARDATTVNGRIELADNAEVGGDVRNVNNEIRVGKSARVGGKIVTRSGNITLLEDARARGIEVKAGNWFRKLWEDLFGDAFDSHRPLVSIGPGAVVDGDLIFDREVELRVHATAKIGKVTGATVTPY